MTGTSVTRERGNSVCVYSLALVWMCLGEGEIGNLVWGAVCVVVT